jgi:hypothetical protein
MRLESRLACPECGVVPYCLQGQAAESASSTRTAKGSCPRAGRASKCWDHDAHGLIERSVTRRAEPKRGWQGIANEHERRDASAADARLEGGGFRLICDDGAAARRDPIGAADVGVALHEARGARQSQGKRQSPERFIDKIPDRFSQRAYRTIAGAWVV